MRASAGDRWGSGSGSGPFRAPVGMAGAVGALVLGLALSACSGTTTPAASRQSRATTGGAPTSTTSGGASTKHTTGPQGGSGPVSVPATASTSPGSTTTTTTVPAALAGLVTELLTTADLPSGWSSSGLHSGTTSAATNLPATAPACLRAVDSIQSTFGSLSATFTDSAAGLKLQETLVQASSPAAASSAYGQLTSTLATCNSTGSPGAASALVVSPVALPSVAQPSTALSITVRTSSATTASVAVLGPRGDVIWVVALAGSSTPNSATLSTIANAALAKIPAG